MFRNIRWRLRPSFFLGWVLAPAILIALAPAANAGQLLDDGVVVDSAAGVAYLMSPDGNIDAVELSTGALRWRSSDAAKPLHLADGLLIAQGVSSERGSLELVALDTLRNGNRQTGMSLELGAEVFGSIDDLPGRAFRCEVKGNLANLEVSWRETRVVDGRLAMPAPSLDEVLKPTKSVDLIEPFITGAMHVDLAARRATPITQSEFSSSVRRAAVRRDNFLPGLKGRQTLSADGRHVLVTTRTGAPGEWQKYQWAIYTAAGDLVGRMGRHTASAPFQVTGTTLVFVDRPFVFVTEGQVVDQPLKLRGVDLVDGGEIWSQPIRDTAYRGPFPP